MKKKKKKTLSSFPVLLKGERKDKPWKGSGCGILSLSSSSHRGPSEGLEKSQTCFPNLFLGTLVSFNIYMEFSFRKCQVKQSYLVF